MKLFFLPALCLVAISSFAQPKLITQATITTNTNVIAPDEEDVAQIQPQGGGGGGFNFRNFGDGETKSTTIIKNDLVKTIFKSESFRGTLYRNNATKTTTTIFEIMGNKQGIVATDSDQEDMRKRMDSTMRSRENANTDSTKRPRVRTIDANSNATVAYTEETKKIAGYNCKKALIITDKIIAKDTQAVWYTPEIKFAHVASTGGTSGIANISAGSNNFDKVDGFVMMYERKMPRGRIMEVKVTKIEIDKDIADKEFDIPKDVEIKTMKEMQTQGGAGFRVFGGRGQ